MPRCRYPHILLVVLALATPVWSAGFARHDSVHTAIFSDFRYEGRQPANGTVRLDGNSYLNPVIAGSYSDPAIVRVGRDYYLTNASFTLFPGGPILHSRDLVHWKHIGAAISRPEQFSYKGLDTWQGDYANDLKYRNGIFYFSGACQGCGGPFLMTTRNPAGVWSGPVFLQLEGIDTSIFFDDDGRAYLLICGPPPGGAKWEGHRAILMQELDLNSLKLIGERFTLVDGGDDPGGKPYWLEGPHLLKHEGRYVLIAAQGGTKEAHTQVAFRADRLRGPYVPRPRNPILSQIGLDAQRRFPVTQAGHADFVRTQAGEWWAVFLASRPWSADELTYNTGRETFLLPLRWKDGWPEILPKGEAVPLKGSSAPPAGRAHGRAA